MCNWDLKRIFFYCIKNYIYSYKWVHRKGMYRKKVCMYRFKRILLYTVLYTEFIPVVSFLTADCSCSHLLLCVCAFRFLLLCCFVVVVVVLCEFCPFLSSLTNITPSSSSCCSPPLSLSFFFFKKNSAAFFFGNFVFVLGLNQINQSAPTTKPK